MSPSPKGLARSLLHSLDWKTRQRVLELLATLRRNKNSRWVDYAVEAIAEIPKHTDPTKLIDRLLRYERAMGEEIDFKGKTVVEIGAGPMLGWALVGFGRGARRYYIVEPSFNPNAVARFAPYFHRHQQWIRRTIGPVDDVTGLLSNGSIQVLSSDASQTGIATGSVDLVLSNSVLEHIHDMPDMSKEMERICAPGAAQYHFMDLTDHTGGADPFKNIYGYHPSEFRSLFSRRGLPINLLRTRDVIEIFNERFDVTCKELLQDSSHPSVESPHPYWDESYTKHELGIELGALKLVRNLVAASNREKGSSF